MERLAEDIATHYGLAHDSLMSIAHDGLGAAGGAAGSNLSRALSTELQTRLRAEGITRLSQLIMASRTQNSASLHNSPVMHKAVVAIDRQLDELASARLERSDFLEIGAAPDTIPAMPALEAMPQLATSPVPAMEGSRTGSMFAMPALEPLDGYATSAAAAVSDMPALERIDPEDVVSDHQKAYIDRSDAWSVPMPKLEYVGYADSESESEAEEADDAGPATGMPPLAYIGGSGGCDGDDTSVGVCGGQTKVSLTLSMTAQSSDQLTTHPATGLSSDGGQSWAYGFSRQAAVVERLGMEKQAKVGRWGAYNDTAATVTMPTSGAHENLLQLRISTESAPGQTVPLCTLSYTRDQLSRAIDDARAHTDGVYLIDLPAAHPAVKSVLLALEPRHRGVRSVQAVAVRLARAAAAQPTPATGLGGPPSTLAAAATTDDEEDIRVSVSYKLQMGAAGVTSWDESTAVSVRLLDNITGTYAQPASGGGRRLRTVVIEQDAHVTDQATALAFWRQKLAELTKMGRPPAAMFA